ncbi:MAG: glutathione S-transferase family protein [Hyphomicrobium sp.]|nr:glutathione S-transferase family protein [Hyphomicrobium sp.]
MPPPLTLVSHALCPYVQRAAIVLKEKGVAFERRDVDLSDKPDWFLRVSPLGKTPVLLVGDAAVFESAVICEYLDETVSPRMHPDDALERARHRAWMEFGSAILGLVAAFYNAGDESSLAKRAGDIRARFEQLEAKLGVGPYFAGTDFSIVDAVFAPVFRYFDLFDQIDGLRLLAGLSKVDAWRTALSQRSSVIAAVTHDFTGNLHAFLLARPSALSRRLKATGQGGV